MHRASKQVLCTMCIWQWYTCGHVVKLPIWTGYHIFLNLYLCNKYICTIEVLPPWVVPIFCLAHELIVARSFVMSSLMNRLVHFSFLTLCITDVFTLCVVMRTMMSRGVDRSSALFPMRSERTTSLLSIFTSSFRAARSFTRQSVSSFAVTANPRIHTVLRREYCSSSSHRSSRLTTLTCASPRSVRSSWRWCHWVTS